MLFGLGAVPAIIATFIYALAETGTASQATLQLAAFSRDPLSAGETPALCGTFNYFDAGGEGGDAGPSSGATDE